MSFSWDSSVVKPILLTVVNSHKILRARQSTFTQTGLQRLRELGECDEKIRPAGADCQLLLDPAEILLPDFACEVRASPEANIASPGEDIGRDGARRRHLAVLADCLLLLVSASQDATCDLISWMERGLSRTQWQVLTSEMATVASVCLRGVRIEALPGGAALSLVWPERDISVVELEPLTCPAADLLELLRAASQLDMRGLLVQLPPEPGSLPGGVHSELLLQSLPPKSLLLSPNSAALSAAATSAGKTPGPQLASSQQQSQAQSPLSPPQGTRSPRFFKRKFGSLWAFFGTGGAPVAQPSRMFYAALASPELESCLDVARKPRARRQKLWAVLQDQSLYFFKQRSAGCNAEFEVDLVNLIGLEVTEDAAAKEARRDPLSPSGLRTVTLRFSNSKKCVYLTPLDKFDLRRWVDTLERLLSGGGAGSGGCGGGGGGDGGVRSDETLDEDGLSRLQARRLSGLSNSFHNLSSANNSRPPSPPPGSSATAGASSGAKLQVGRDGRLGVPANLNNREMMASCTNLDELSGRQSPARCGAKYLPGGHATMLNSQDTNMPIITVNCTDDHSPQNESEDEEEEDCQLKKLEIWRSSSDSVDQLTPEEIAELKRRRISTEIQLQSLQSEIKKREVHLSAKQLQALNVQISDLYDDIQELSTTLSKVGNKSKGIFAQFKKKSF